jgi:hypothetical protein
MTNKKENVMQNQNDLIEAINSAVEAKVFSVEVLQNIAELRKSVTEQVARLETYSKNEIELRSKCGALQDRVDAYARNEEAVSKREKDVASKELAQALMAKENELIKGFKSELKEVVMAAFKNPVIKQEMFGSESQPGQNGGYPQSVPVNKTTTTTHD